MDLDLLQQTLDRTGQPSLPRSDRSGTGPPAAPASYEEMTNLPLALREALTETVPFSTLTVEHQAHSSDGTIKALHAYQQTDARSSRC